MAALRSAAAFRRASLLPFRDRVFAPQKRAADFAEKQYFHMKILAIIRNTQHVANADFARRFGRLAVGLNPAKSQAREARERVLKNRAAQSHLSMRTEVIGLIVL
jgi:hypothetical protein